MIGPSRASSLRSSYGSSTALRAYRAACLYGGQFGHISLKVIMREFGVSLQTSVRADRPQPYPFCGGKTCLSHVLDFFSSCRARVSGGPIRGS